jgi:hypothetical protein
MHARPRFWKVASACGAQLFAVAVRQKRGLGDEPVVTFTQFYADELGLSKSVWSTAAASVPRTGHERVSDCRESELSGDRKATPSSP